LFPQPASCAGPFAPRAARDLGPWSPTGRSATIGEPMPSS